MKGKLCATSTLVAVGVAAGRAEAASALQLGITGFYRNTIGVQWGNSPGAITTGGSFVGYGDNHRTTASMRQEIRINFTGETKLDNGITVGVLVGLNGENVEKSGSNEQIYNAYAYFNGTFGQIRIGEADSALVTNCVLDPGNVTWNFGINSPWESYSNVGRAAGPVATPATQGIGFTFGVAPVGSIGTCFGIETRGNKFIYFSPIFDGFSFAASFAPQGNSRFAGGGLAYGTDVTSDPVDDVLSVYANYEHSFKGWSLTAGAGGEWSFASHTSAGGAAPHKAAMYSTGVQVGFGPWKVGASGAYYQSYSKDGYAATFAGSDDNGWVVTAGGSYSVGNWAFGLEGMGSQWGELSHTTHETIWGISLNGTYALSDSIDLEGQVAFTYADYGNVGLHGSTIPSVHGLEVDFGTNINY